MNAERPIDEKAGAWSKKWHLLVEAAKRCLEEQGYELERVPGRGLSNIWTTSKNGQSQIASIRTTQDRWFAFPPLNDGKNWKTLDDVDTVVVAAVDDREDPRNVEVYVFPADEVRRRFKLAYKARTQANQTVKNNFGMWVALDNDERGIAASVGSGIGEQFPPLAVYPVEDLGDDPDPRSSLANYDPELAEDGAPRTIGEVLEHACSEIASIAGVGVEAVNLDLKIAY
tara:strand:- start:108808 stop:109491 length:684 start_codon:yes stop_codon:yes gene_type:complete